jgi:cyclohexa-1,5-dienecarbonyl-CoA hydratase
MIDVSRNERVLHLVINAPPVNVLDAAVLGALYHELERHAGDDSIAAVVLSGEGRCFSAGASVEEHSADKADGMLTALLDAGCALADFPAPAVALVHGACLGGAPELISFCDYVVADPEATFGQPEIKLAFFPPIACVQLVRMTGLQNAAYVALTGDTLSADRALQMGMVQQLLARDEWAKVEKTFNRLSVPVLRLTKKALRQGSGGYCRETLDGVKQLFLDELYELEDVAEGMASFAEKRRPQWKHR